MRCIGRNRDFTKCKNQPNFIVCTKHIPQLIILLCITLPTLLLTYYGIYKIFIEKDDIFIVRNTTSLIFGYPGPLVFMYFNGNDTFNIAPIGLSIFLEIINDQSTTNKIINYDLELKIDNKWENIPVIHSKESTLIYWVNNPDLKSCTRLDFRDNSFDEIVINKYLTPWQIYKSWIFLEWPIKYRKDIPKITSFRIKIFDLYGKKHTFVLEGKIAESALPDNESGGTLKFYQPIQKDNLSNLKVIPYCDYVKLK